MTVGIVGLGMIGGSIGLALREPGRRIIGHDVSDQNARVAADRQCVDLIGSFEEAVSADLVFLAVPPDHVTAVLDRVQSQGPRNNVVTDCTSVKAPVVEWARENGAHWFVPGHPMSGHEKTGPAYASAWMFRNARWILTPMPSTLKSAIRLVESLVKTMGAVPVLTDAAGHDRQIAVLSHLPHAFAAILVTMAAELPNPEVAGGSWRDLTRVGGVDPELWTQILMGNREEVARSLEKAESGLVRLRRALMDRDTNGVKKFFEDAQKAKRHQDK